MVSFPSTVNAPGAASFSSGVMDFSTLGNLYNDYKQTGFDEQQKKLNDVTLQQKQQQIELAKSFAGGLPTDPATGQVDYRKAAAILASKGDIGGAVSLLQQAPPPLSPMFGGGQPQQGVQPQGQPPPGVAPQGQPSSVQARPLPPPGRGPQGDSGAGTITSLVTDRLPSQNQTTGETIGKIAQVMGVDPNSDLTPGQQKRAQGLLKKYAPEIAGSGSMSFTDRFAGDGRSPLPPSANAATPAPTLGATAGTAAGRTGAPVSPGGGAGAPVPAQGQPGGGGPQQQPQGQGPITPQVPLPQGFKDPEQAIQALRTEAVRLGQVPNGQSQAAALNDWATRIEASLKPLSVGATTTLIDPRTGKPVYQGPAAAAMAGAGGRSETIESDAQVYRQTGKLPPNIGRGVQGNAESHAIRELAREQEISEGGDPGDWPSRWQKFGTQAAGLRTLETRAAGLTLAENEASSLIPRVREASARVSRTQYPSINSLILAAQKGTGATDVIKLGVAVESLIPVYAKILKPVGTVGAADMERAHDILEKKWSDGQINAALDQMEVELKSARTALDKTMDEFGTKKKREGTESDTSKAGSSASKGSTFQNTTPDGFGWSIEK
jgi:hypothetical protein